MSGERISVRAVQGIFWAILVLFGLLALLGFARAAKGQRGQAEPITVYVSRTGDDAADGRTPKTALASLEAAFAKIERGRGDTIALARGSTWSRAGKPALPLGDLRGTGPTRVGGIVAYGDRRRADPRLVDCSADAALRAVDFASGVSWLRVENLSIVAAPHPEAGYTSQRTGILVLGPGSGLAFRGLDVRGFTTQIYVDGVGSVRDGVTVEGCRLVDPEWRGSSQGPVCLYVSWAQDVLVRGNVIGSRLEWIRPEAGGTAKRRGGSTGNAPPLGTYMTDLTRGVRIESNIVGFGPTGLRARGGAAFVNNVILGCGVGIEASASSIEPGATPDPQVYTGNVIDGCDVGTDWNGSGDSRPTGWGIFSNGDQAATLSGNLIRGPVYHARGLAAVTFHRVQPIEDRTPTRVVDYVAIEPPPTPEYLARRDQRARLFAQSATRGRSETPERISTLAAFIAETIRGATP